MLKVTDVLAESDRSWEEASLRAIQQASEIVRGIKSIRINNVEGQADSSPVNAYRTTARARLDRDSHNSTSKQTDKCTAAVS